MLSKILLTPLRQIEVSGGNVLHSMKKTDDGYAGFGEAYFSWIEFGAIKGWKLHTQMTMNIVVPVGQVRFVFYSYNTESDKSYRVEEIGVDRYVRITIPPNIWFGFMGLYKSKNLILNIANTSHNPDEVQRLELPAIDFNWLGK
jgi:dTDP-4-dehydrorhamnose 3,5-epimerase